MNKKEVSKENKRKARRTALIVSIVLFVIGIVSFLLLDHYMLYVRFNLFWLIVGNVAGFFLLYSIIYKYELSDCSPDEEQNHNIY